MLLLKTAKVGRSPGFLQTRLCLGMTMSFLVAGKQSVEETVSEHAGTTRNTSPRTQLTEGRYCCNYFPPMKSFCP